MFKLQPNPTFRTKVGIVLPGQQKPAEIEVEFKFLSRSAAQAMAFRPERDGTLRDDAATLGLRPRAGAAEIERHVGACVALFLRAHAPDPGPRRSRQGGPVR